MGSKFDKALSGFNTNVNFGGKIYHVQTEDSGKSKPKIVTHVFLNGNIIATKKQSYETFLERPDVDDIVREMMKNQHLEMVNLTKEGKIAENVIGGGEAKTPEPLQSKPARSSGEYRVILSTPSQGLQWRRRRKTTDPKRVSKIREKAYIAGQEIEMPESKENMKRNETGKTLEEIIAEYLSEKVEK